MAFLLNFDGITHIIFHEEARIKCFTHNTLSAARVVLTKQLCGVSNLNTFSSLFLCFVRSRNKEMNTREKLYLIWSNHKKYSYFLGSCFVFKLGFISQTKQHFSWNVRMNNSNIVKKFFLTSCSKMFLFLFLFFKTVFMRFWWFYYYDIKRFCLIEKKNQVFFSFLNRRREIRMKTCSFCVVNCVYSFLSPRLTLRPRCYRPPL